MWYTVESDKSTIRNEGETSSKATYQSLRELFRLPSFKAVTVGLAGDLSGLLAWAEEAHVKVLPFTFEKDKRIRLDLVPKAEDGVVGDVWYGASETIVATFNRTRDAIDVLGMFYPHWLISYGRLNGEYQKIAIREILEKL
jgi:hypothetical protein